MAEETTRKRTITAPELRIHIARSEFKFSCAHMTVFPNGTKERLHGHNYTVGVELELRDPSFTNMVPFSEIKVVLAKLCAAFKERVLLATLNPFYKLIADRPNEVEFSLCGARYVLPKEDVLFLPVDNIAVEPLAAHFLTLLLQECSSLIGPRQLLACSLKVEESPGQGATVTSRFH